MESIYVRNATFYTFSRAELGFIPFQAQKIYSNGHQWRKYLKVSETSAENIKQKEKLNLLSP